MAQPTVTHPTLDDVISALTGVLGPVRDLRKAERLSTWMASWDTREWFVDLDGTGDVVEVRFDAKMSKGAQHVHERQWLVTRDGAPIDGDDTVTLDALPGLVAASVSALGLGEAVTT